jgi:hypothetical protein
VAPGVRSCPRGRRGRGDGSRAALVEALKLAREEIKHPGSARRAGKDVEAIIDRAIRRAEDDRDA